MSNKDFLVEIGTEELPPKALKKLSDAFSAGILSGLSDAGIKFESSKSFAAPRRLALHISGLALQQADKKIEKRGPAKRAAFDENGEPTRAVLGFTKSLGIEPSDLEEMETPKGTWLIYKSMEAGKATSVLIGDIVAQSLAKLPIPKRMRWGVQKEEFVRPVQWVLMLLGTDIVAGETLGIKHGNTTRGHRFMSSGELTIKTPGDYESTLLEEGKVIADFDQRKAIIKKGVEEIAKTVKGLAIIDEELLDEVNSLNEWPTPLLGNFDHDFLNVPEEALISSMKEHQKYFHVLSDNQRILPHFITVSNIESKDPAQVVSGNERVIRPRLADAAFFFETDKKTTLASKREPLKNIVFQTKLGTVFDKTERVSKLAQRIAQAIGSDAESALKAGQLAKSDLVSEMVLEFTDLQGVMAYHYALYDGESEEVALALNEQYMPKQAGGELPSTQTGCALAIAEKLDSLVGLFGINQPPTGTKDPFALRRAALGVLRIIVEKQLDLDLRDVISWSAEQYASLHNTNLETQLLDYLLERFRAWYDDEGISAEVFLAVSARKPTKPIDFDKRIRAVADFNKLDQAEALAAANKRVSNILAKNEASIASELNSELLTEAAEQKLAEHVTALQAQVEPLFSAGNYAEALNALAELQGPVDAFFEDVMVMAEDEAVRNNRVALLDKLRALFLQAADISLLSR